MATDYVNEVQKLYVAYFSRPADAGGLNYWTGVLQTNPNGWQEISAAFSTSAEYRAAYAGLDNRGIVNEVYENLFGRSAEPGGLDFWVNHLNNNAITIDNVVTQIAAGAQGNDRVVYNGKVAVSTTFTDRLDTAQERTAYSGDAANRIAIEYVAGVRDLQSAASHMDYGQIDAVIAEIVGTPSGMAEFAFPVV